MSELSATEARGELSEVINRAAYGKERVIVTRRGRRLAAVIPLEDLELLEELENGIDLEAVREARKEQGREPAEPWESVKERLGLGGATAPVKRAAAKRAARRK